MKIEKGVMVMKDGNAWGETYSDGQSTNCGWVDIESAPIHDPQCCNNPTDVTYRNSPYVQELLTAKVVMVERIISVRVLELNPTSHP